ncbi:MAG: GMP synthase [Gammaproteobacteria bacterium]|nr:GMP synthase [Gammaproteobacteria bacterium]
MKLGILKIDSVRAEFQAEFGDYPSMFESILTDAGTPDDPVEVRVYDVEHGELPKQIDECDAYLITGSRESVYDDLPWLRALKTFVIELDRVRKPLVGICFGHQLVAHILGGETKPANVGWAVGVHEARIVERAPWMEPYQPSFNLLASHKDQVATLPARAELFAANGFCPYGGFTIDDHIITFQGHPEFEKGYSRALMNLRREILGEAVYASGIASLEKSVDTDVVARWIVNFIRRARQCG